MAACGLQPGRKNSLEAISATNSLPLTSSGSRSALAEAARASEADDSSFDAGAKEPFSRGKNAAVMANFAAAMMRAIKTSHNCASQRNFQMRIGKY